LQLEITPQTSVQGEFRYRLLDRGDLRLRFFSQDFLTGQRDSEERTTARFGLRHSFSPESTFLASLIHQEVVFRTDVNQLPFPFISLGNRRPESATSVEFQHLFRSRYVDLTSGAGYAKVDGHLDGSSTIFGLPSFIARFPTDLKHVNAYAYSYINPIKDLTITVGASGDFTDGESPDVGHRQQFNPKFGVLWNPLPDTTVRVAAFRVLKRTLVTDQTVEPTQVAGFNQFYDDNNGTRAWRYGGGIDQKLGQTLFGGLEASRRDLKSPFVQRDVFSATATGGKEDMTEDSSRIYLFWTPHDWLAFRLEYSFEHFRSDGMTDQPIRLQTHRVPFGISFFHPTGFGAALRTTYISQGGRFVLTDGTTKAGSDSFAVLDAAINYRLPNRYGLISFGASNLTDKKFRFFDRDTRNPSIQPGRMLFGKITLALP
jgi:hypothetical protein